MIKDVNSNVLSCLRFVVGISSVAITHVVGVYRDDCCKSVIKSLVNIVLLYLRHFSCENLRFLFFLCLRMMGYGFTFWSLGVCEINGESEDVDVESGVVEMFSHHFDCTFHWEWMRWGGKQTTRFINVGLVSLMNSVCCTYSARDIGKWLLTCVLSSGFFHSSPPSRLFHSKYPLLPLFPLTYHPLHLCDLTFPPLPTPNPLTFFHLPWSVTSLQALTCSPTARRSARPWVTQTAAGCPPLCRLTGARGRTTAATCTSPAWTPRCPTLRYPPPPTCPINSPWPRPPPRPTIGHSPPLARTVKGHSHTKAFTITSISNSRSTAPAR